MVARYAPCHADGLKERSPDVHENGMCGTRVSALCPCETEHAICMNLDRNVERRGSDDPHEGPSNGNGLGAIARDQSIHLKQGGVLVNSWRLFLQGAPNAHQGAER